MAERVCVGGSTWIYRTYSWENGTDAPRYPVLLLIPCYYHTTAILLLLLHAAGIVHASLYT